MKQTVNKILLLLLGAFLSLQSRSSSIKASAFGFSLKDATACLQKAFDSSADTVIVDNVGQWNVAPVFVNQNNKTIIFERGVLLKALSGRYDINDCVLNISANALNPNIRKNITLIGYGATIQMRKNEYTEKINGEFRHCLTIDNAENIIVLGLTFIDSGGDGIIIGNASPDNLQGVKYCKDIVIKHCRCINNKRQGLSIISVINLLVEECIFESTDGTAPSAGIDVEPDVEDEVVYNCIIRKCFVQNNAGNGIQVYVPNANPQRHPLSVTIEDCVIKNNRQNGLFIFGPGKASGKSNILVSNCRVVDNNGGIEVANTTAGNITVEQSFFRNAPGKTNAIFTMDYGYNQYAITRGQIFGGIVFSDCSVVVGNSTIFSVKNEKSTLFSGIKGVAGKVYIIDSAYGKRVVKNSYAVDVQSVPKKEHSNKVKVTGVSIDLSRSGNGSINFSPVKSFVPVDIVSRITFNGGIIFEQPISFQDLARGKSSLDIGLMKLQPGAAYLEVIEWGKVIFKTGIPAI